MMMLDETSTSIANTSTSNLSCVHSYSLYMPGSEMISCHPTLVTIMSTKVQPMSPVI